MSYELLALDLDGTLTNDEKKIPEETKKALIDLMRNGKKVALVSGRPVNKLLLCGPPASIDKILARLDEQYGDMLNLFPSEPFFGEIMPKGIDKGYSLGRLAEGLGLSADQIIACGDSGNDIPMIRYAGLGVAMANALPQVKEAADYITLSNREEGVLHVIRTFIDIE